MFNPHNYNSRNDPAIRAAIDAAMEKDDYDDFHEDMVKICKDNPTYRGDWIPHVGTI